MLLCTPAMGGNQLYTGDAATVPVGVLQLQAFQDTTPSRSFRIAGGSLTTGISERLDTRLAYGYLWNNQGPDARIGPNIGLKWRVAGNGRTDPSLAVSGLYAISGGTTGGVHKSDYGALLIGSYPSSFVTFLGNFGRVWVGDTRPDFYYISMAAIRQLNAKTLFAVEYSDLLRIGQVADSRIDNQFAAGVVYTPNRRWSYSAQFAYLPYNPNVHFHTTLGVSRYF